MSWRATLDGRQWEKLFESLEKAASDPSRILLAAFATRGHRAIIEKFDRQEGPDGKWAKRSESTQRHYEEIRSGRRAPPEGFPRAAFNPSNRVLQLTGMLRKSIMPASLSKQTQRLDRERILVMSPVAYSGDHDDGDPSRGLPQRKFMWLNDREMEDMATIILKMAVGE